MRVLLTTDTVGGVWTFTRELAAGLLAAGHAVALLSFGRAPGLEQQLWADATTAAAAGHFLFHASDTPLEWMDRNSEALTGEPELQALVRQFRPDVVHAGQFCWGGVDLPVPVVITAHSDVLSWAASCRPGGLQDSPWLRTYTRLVTRGLAGAAAVTAPTRWMLRALRSQLSVPCPVESIPNGRDLPAPPADAPVRQLRALAAGRLWDEGKGLGLLAKGGWPLPVAVAGERRFEQGEADLPGVELLGQLDESVMLAALRASAVYLCPSLYEPFGLAAVEAGLCGCAVVCRDLPSLREVWGEAALYFTDASGLRALLNSLVDDPTLLAARQAASHARAARYSRRAMTDAYVALYAGVLAGVREVRCA